MSRAQSSNIVVAARASLRSSASKLKPSAVHDVEEGSAAIHARHVSLVNSNPSGRGPSTSPHGRGALSF